MTALTQLREKTEVLLMDTEGFLRLNIPKSSVESISKKVEGGTCSWTSSQAE